MIKRSDFFLAEVLPDAILLLDPLGQLEWRNQAAQRLLGSTSQDLQSILQHPDFRQRLINHDMGELILPGPHNPRMALAITVMPYAEKRYLVIIKDITHTQLLEKMRQDFVANVSHELRTPLTVIRGYLEVLLEQEGEQRWHAIFEQMLQQSQRMQQLVQDLLLLSRLETDLPEAQQLQSVDISALLEQIVKDAYALSGPLKHHITLQVQKGVNLYGQADELHSAFSNIIFNAIHYTPANGSINIDWYANQSGAHLRVQDTGIGIAAGHIPRLTERFYRVDKARSRSSGGTGLGLAIVKHVLLRHEAKLEITSELGKGSTFHCCFPWQRIVKA